ncbi:MAG: protein kinase [Thermoanaerobaculia bacterium]
MTLEAGSKLGPYEIIEPLGAGGMGEVYRARDTRLEREVAIKVIPEHLAENPELRQRLEREARVVSSLQHPNICTLHDIGSENGIDFLVMEFLDGETLAARLEKGPLPIHELFPIASSIADALDKAHRQGLVHRDLKPGNIMLTRTGAKLLDFGLAKGSAALSDPSAPTQSPTMSPLTTEGTLVGTFQYMSPEQLEGEEADARSDLFAFGSVLYEMATGKRAFEGKTQASLIAAVLDREPVPLGELQPMAPPALDRVIRVCLSKDPDERFQSAHDLKLQLEWIRDAGSQAGVPMPVATRRKTRERLAWGVAAAFAVAALVAAALLMRHTAPEQRVLRAEIAPAADTVFSLSPSSPGPVTVSPDGRQIAWAAVGRDGNTKLWVRSLDETTSRDIEGSEGAHYPFWSADSRSVAYFAEAKLKKVDASGGPSITIADATNPKGGTWSEEGVILFAPAHNTPIHKVSADGGPVEPVTQLSSERQENSHRHPRFLPDGRHFMYFTRVGAMGTAVEGSGVWIGSLDGDEPRRLTHASSQAEYASGHLLLARGDALLAQRFDPDRLELSGDPVPLVEGVVAMSGAAIAAFSVSQQGLLAYQIGGGDLTTELAWYNRDGARLKTVGEPAFIGDPTLSPDQSLVAITIGDTETGAGDIWIYDFERNVRSRFTFDPSEDVTPIWSPDGKRLFWASSRVAAFDLYVKDVEGTGAATDLLGSDDVKIPMSVSPDGRYLAYAEGTGGGVSNSDLRVLPLQGDEGPIELSTTEFNEWGAQFSPGGRWIAFQSDESGRPEIYVTSFPEPGRKWQVSTEGGTQPRWRGDGRELYYLTPTASLMVAAVDPSDSGFKIGELEELFVAPRMPVGSFNYDVTSDGERFLIDTVGDSAFEPITLFVNWTAELEGR